ncbi:Hypothetical protein NTJ_05600 [Nesidiocoris tenuis]|uniref:Uncharacterized protein n=1 Tax=Nesidiocoris tenuis TaxID=355587 RepID=A0ABN7API7_9HEMI|nr:Hypothetical protein NTJ_05600 [Nesidiocoris tenuis]
MNGRIGQRIYIRGTQNTSSNGINKSQAVSELLGDTSMRKMRSEVGGKCLASGDRCRAAELSPSAEALPPSCRRYKDMGHLASSQQVKRYPRFESFSLLYAARGILQGPTSYTESLARCLTV